MCGEKKPLGMSELGCEDGCGRQMGGEKKPLEISELACADGCGWAAQNRARESRPKEILRRDSKRPGPSQESPLPRTPFRARLPSKTEDGGTLVL